MTSTPADASRTLECWGTISKSSNVGTSKHPLGEEEDIGAQLDSPGFISPTTRAKVAQAIDSASVLEFISHQQQQKRRVVLITSGVATAALDLRSGGSGPVPFVQPSTIHHENEHRGAACAEALLRRGYGVIFLHSRVSSQPFNRHFTQAMERHGRKRKLIDRIVVPRSNKVTNNRADTNEFTFCLKNDDDDPDKEDLDRMLQEYQEFMTTKKTLCEIEFEHVQDYLLYLREIARAMSTLANRGMIVLGASVAKLCTLQQQQEHREPLAIYSVPNIIRTIKQQWCTRAYLVTFHNTPGNDSSDLEPQHVLVHGREKSYLDLEKHGMNLVVVDTRASPDIAMFMLVTEQHLKSSEDMVLIKKSKHSNLEDKLVHQYLVPYHAEFIFQARVLRQSKELLLLSAKFSMMKEHEFLNEDALGNKRVKFEIGIRIRSNRRLGQASPVYELLHIVTNGSHSARCHIWTRVFDTQPKKDTDSSSRGELLVVFSPAGTPDTIRSVWSDFWTAWEKRELDAMERQVVTLRSALATVAAPLTGDFSSAAQTLTRMWKHIGTIWTVSEQTRVRQSLQNVLSLCFQRGLVEFHDSEEEEEDAREAQDRANVANHKSLSKQPSMTSILMDDLDEGPPPLETTEALLAQAQKSPRVHATLAKYYREMNQDLDLVDIVRPYVQRQYQVRISGYSMGGMLSQLFALKLGESVMRRSTSSLTNLTRKDDAPLSSGGTRTLENVCLVVFGTPRAGDASFCARLRLLYHKTHQRLNVIHPSDTVHAFPPTSEGYSDGALKKVFLKADGLGIGRRTSSMFSILPVTRSIDRMFETNGSCTHPDGDSEDDPHDDPSPRVLSLACALCSSMGHRTEQHRCRYCTQRGHHRGQDCLEQTGPCGFCGKASHATGAHKCQVCGQVGQHQGRFCHLQRDVGSTELIAYFRYHDFIYYNSVMQQGVEFQQPLV